MSKFLDLTGQKFGKLTIIGKGKDYIYPNGIKKEVRWRVRCEDCGIEYKLKKTSFLITKNQDCDKHSHTFEDLTGQKFGKLTVIKKDEKYYISPKWKKKSIKWICKCNCGNSFSIIGDILKAKKATQCQECRYKSRQLNGYISYQRLHSIKQSAKKRNIYFDPKINRKYLWNLFLEQNKKCALSSLPIHFAETIKDETSHKGTTASLDRIDSSKVYVKNNIQWLHKDINKMKFTYSNKKFISTCQDIINNSKKDHKYNLAIKNKNKELISHALWYRIRKGAENRNILFSKRITKQLLWELYLKQNKKCILTGWEIHLAKDTKYYKYNTASLDRINSSKNYTLSNIQWVHKDLNRMKWDFSQDYFIKLCGLIAEHNK